jgi:hypothetical protein
MWTGAITAVAMLVPWIAPAGLAAIIARRRDRGVPAVEEPRMRQRS